MRVGSHIPHQYEEKSPRFFLDLLFERKKCLPHGKEN